MSIELELRLEGQDANEETLLELMDWLEWSDIDGLTIQRKALPPVEGYQSTELDLVTFTMIALTIPQTIVAVRQLTHDIAEIFTQWQQETESQVSINPKLNNVSAEMEQLNQQIQAILDEMKQKCQKHK